MTSRSLPKRVAVAAAALGVTAIVGAAPALAAQVKGENIFGSGSSLQKVAQRNIWTPTWQSTAADHATLSNNPSVTYTSSSSGGGLDEFGNNTGALDLTKDPTADAGSSNGFGRPVLDAYAGTDDPPIGPVTTPGTQLANASEAATGGSQTTVDELTIPVAQAPVAVLISLPTGIKLGTSTKISLTNQELRQIWNAIVPASKDYATKTWGALLEDAGLTRVAGTPGSGQFSDAGGATGGTQKITLQVRSSASGTSYTFKGFLNLSGDPDYPQSFVVDDDTWPVATTNTGNTGGSQLVTDTTKTPGSVGYANLADARTASPSYTRQAQNVLAGGAHQILYALIQSNNGGKPAVFADPQGSVGGTANVYSGNNININGANPSGVGHWNVPLSGSTFQPTGSWGGTLADDPDVYDHSINNGVKTDNYPIVAATYDLAWSEYDAAGSNLIGQYGGTNADNLAAGYSVASFARYMVSASGQSDLTNAKLYYAQLPQTIDTYAVAAAAKVHP